MRFALALIVATCLLASAAVVASASPPPYVVMQQTKFRTDLKPPLSVRIATDPILEWPFQSSTVVTSKPDPFEARLKIVVAGAVRGTRIPTKAIRTCSRTRYGATTATTKTFALTFRAGTLTLLPAAAMATHDDVGCSWLLTLTVTNTSNPTVTLYAPAIVSKNYKPNILTPDGIQYDREACVITQKGGSTSRACHPL